MRSVIAGSWLSVESQGAGLDQSDVQAEGALAESGREHAGEAACGRCIATVERDLSSTLQRVVGPGVVGIGGGHLLELGLRFIQQVLLLERLGNAKLDGRHERRLRKSFERRFEHPPRTRRIISFELDCGQFERRERSRGEGCVGRQVSQNGSASAGRPIRTRTKARWSRASGS